MKLRRMQLGTTGLMVTELCFGALPLGPLQKNLGLSEGAAVIAHALKAGINFIDTAQVYRTYPYIREAIRVTGFRPIVASKSSAATYEDMETAVRQALDELALEKIDLFLLHAARVGPEVFTERAGALRALLDCKERGLVGAVGISTHDVRITLQAAARPEIEVVFPIFNKEGRGILNGTRAEMAAAIRRNYEAGKGVYLMKIFGGGTLLDEYQACLDYVRREVPYHSVAVGMVAEAEVDYNLACLAGGARPDMTPSVKAKQVQVSSILCRGCGTCLAACHSAAISLAGDKARIDPDVCLRCGYCIPACPQFAIRVV